jgi:hypothetical protein
MDDSRAAEVPLRRVSCPRYMRTSRHARPAARLALLLTLFAVALPASAAFGQASPFEGLPAPTPETPTQATTQINSSNDDDDGLSSFQAILIAGAAIALLTGVIVVIMRDAKRRAPIEAGDSEAAHKPADAHKRSQAAKRKQRQKAKAARAQRRRNR